MPTYVGGYLRWRPRMVQASVFADLKATLARTNWTGAQQMGILTRPLTVIDAFPEDGAKQGHAPVANTFALDDGQPGELALWELGGRYVQPYRFEMAFYAQDSAVGRALLSDLADRYNGISWPPFLDLNDYAQDPPVAVTQLECESFIWTKTPAEVAPENVDLFYAQLLLNDWPPQDGPT